MFAHRVGPFAFKDSQFVAFGEEALLQHLRHRLGAAVGIGAQQGDPQRRGEVERHGVSSMARRGHCRKTDLPISPSRVIVSLWRLPVSSRKVTSAVQV